MIGSTADKDALNVVGVLGTTEAGIITTRDGREASARRGVSGGFKPQRLWRTEAAAA